MKEAALTPAGTQTRLKDTTAHTSHGELVIPGSPSERANKGLQRESPPAGAGGRTANTAPGKEVTSHWGLVMSAQRPTKFTEETQGTCERRE